MPERVFVFRTRKKTADGRSRLIGVPEQKLVLIASIAGSQNCYLQIGVQGSPSAEEVEGSFDDLVALLGERVEWPPAIEPT